MSAFMTHPSVRIKGTENNYEPMVCVYPKCADRPPHMHCPFCVKTEIYPDPVILKAHYRVKHVDKGLDFAGLKILRCCDHCDIVGTIKGEKKFKGPHWHCYKCRNGFNRRDEAIKHYRTHFRNPQTTFQIQVAQDVNVMLNSLNSSESAEAIESIGDHNQFNIHGSLAENYYTAEAFNNHKTDTSAQVAANETVDASDAQTIMIIQERQAQNEYKDGLLLQQSEQLSYEELLQQKANLERHLGDLEALRADNEKLKQHNLELSQQIGELQEELVNSKQNANDQDCEKLNQLIEKFTSDLQYNAKQVLLEQLKKVKSETSQLLSPNPVQNVDAAIQTEITLPEADIKPILLVPTDKGLSDRDNGPRPKRTRATRSS